MKTEHDKDINTTIAEKAKISPTSLLSNRGILLILSSNLFGKTYIIRKPKTIIGRLDKCDITINDPLISKEHCVIILDEYEKFYIEDLNSKNSTYINGKEIKKRTHIIYGDRIIIGNTIIRFYLEEKLEKKEK